MAHNPYGATASSSAELRHQFVASGCTTHADRPRHNHTPRYGGHISAETTGEPPVVSGLGVHVLFDTWARLTQSTQGARRRLPAGACTVFGDTRAVLLRSISVHSGFKYAAVTRFGRCQELFAPPALCPVLRFSLGVRRATWPATAGFQYQTPRKYLDLWGKCR